MLVWGDDAHTLTRALVAVDPAGLKLGQKTIATTSAAHAECMRWAAAHFGSDILWAVEDCHRMTARLEDDLLTARPPALKEFAELVDLAARHGWAIPPDEGPLRRLSVVPVPRVVLPDLLAEDGEFGGNQFRH